MRVRIFVCIADSGKTHLPGHTIQLFFQLIHSLTRTVIAQNVCTFMNAHQVVSALFTRVISGCDSDAIALQLQHP